MSRPTGWRTARYIAKIAFLVCASSLFGCSQEGVPDAKLDEIQKTVAGYRDIVDRLNKDNAELRQKINAEDHEIVSLKYELTQKQQAAKKHLDELEKLSSEQNASSRNSEELTRRLSHANLERAKTRSAINSEKNNIPQIIKQIQNQTSQTVAMLAVGGGAKSKDANPLKLLEQQKEFFNTEMQFVKNYATDVNKKTLLLDKKRDALKYRVANTSIRVEGIQKKIRKAQTAAVATPPASSESKPIVSTPTK